MTSWARGPGRLIAGRPESAYTSGGICRAAAEAQENPAAVEGLSETLGSIVSDMGYLDFPTPWLA